MSSAADSRTGEQLRTDSGEQTEQLGDSLGQRLRRGDIVLLSGDLGAGKTTFARGICRALGVTEPVTSPTFTIGQIYEGRDRHGDRLPVSHLDLYRLAGLEDEDPALIEDYLGSEGIALLEWPDVALEPLADRVSWRVSIEHDGEDQRLLTISAS